MSFDKRPSYMLEHLVRLVGGELIAFNLGAQAHPQRMQRVKGRIVRVVGSALFPILPYGHIVTMGFASPCGAWEEHQERQKNGASHGRTFTES